jgi:hypothetical protein
MGSFLALCGLHTIMKTCREGKLKVAAGDMMEEISNLFEPGLKRGKKLKKGPWKCFILLLRRIT